MFWHKNKMFNQIKKLQQKSFQTRKRITLGVSAGVTFIVAVVWLSVFNLNSNNIIVENTEKETIKNSEIASPFTKIKDDLAKIFTRTIEYSKNVKTTNIPTNSLRLNSAQVGQSSDLISTTTRANTINSTSSPQITATSTNLKKTQ